MTIQITHNKDNIYDVYDKNTGKWLFSTGAADNVFSRLSQMAAVRIEFEDKTLPDFRGKHSKAILSLDS